MKRLTPAVIPALMLSLSLLVSACAPSSNMVATLTELPFAATPHTATPFPTFTPRASSTPSPGATPDPTVVDGVGTGPTGTPTLDSTVAAALTLAVVASDTPAPACPPFAFDTVVPIPDVPANYISRHYDLRNLPQGIKGYTSGLLETDTYSWAHVQVQNRDMYWIQKLVCRDASGQPYWEIVDAITLPIMDAQAHEVTVDLCFQGDQDLPFAIAYGPYDPNKPAASVVAHFVGWPIQVKAAWQMKDKFIPLNPKGLTCMLQEQQKTK